jgi:hypothetical protein
MPWWGWIVVGAALLGGEMIVDTQFYLVFFGVAALVTGGLALLGLTGPAWLQWAIFGVLIVAGALGFRRRLYGMLRGRRRESGTVGELCGRPRSDRAMASARPSCAAPSGKATRAQRRSPRRARAERVEGLVRLHREG